MQGVFAGDCDTELDHGVAIVGYITTIDGTKYWTVKNWDRNGEKKVILACNVMRTGMGRKNYISMQREVDAEEGVCVVAMKPS